MSTNNNDIQIRELIKNWAQAVRDKNIDLITAHHADDILMFDVVGPLQLKGIDDYRTSWEETFFPWYGEDGQFEVTALEVTAGEEVAFCTGIINCGGTENGQKVSYQIRLTICLQKINDEWIVMHEHHSEPLAATKP